MSIREDGTDSLYPSPAIRRFFSAIYTISQHCTAQSKTGAVIRPSFMLLDRQASEKIAVPFSKMAATTISTRNHFFILPLGDFHYCLCPK